MKKKHLFLAVLAIVLILSVSLGTALAYFTSYAGANGGYIIHIGHETEIEESIEGNVKSVTIYNIPDEDTGNGLYPVFVRARVYGGSDVVLTVTGEGWTQDVDNWYYDSALFTGDHTTTLEITVEPAENAGVRPGDPIDVLVIYESVPAVFTAGGDPDFDTAWSNAQNIVVIKTQ